MIRQVFVAECDICGITQKAKPETFRNETSYTLPNGWMRSKANNQFIICPECWRKLTQEETQV